MYNLIDMVERKIIKKWKSGKGYRYKLLCNNCGKEFEITGAQLLDKCLYCSIKCSNSSKDKIQKINSSKIERVKENGCLFSKEARKRMSNAQKERFKDSKEREKLSIRMKNRIKKYGHPKGMLRKIPWNKGKKCKRWKGKNNPNWNNGSSLEEYSDEFNKRLKRKIRNRENFSCKICNKTEKELKRRLDIHHIDYNKKNNNENNLVALCHKCHMKTNYRRNYWKKEFERYNY